MPLNKQKFKNDILSLLTQMRERTEKSDEEFAERLASLIDGYIKSATITVPAGIAVSTTGSPTAQTGATTASAIAKIS
ncbi:MAG: hypothetical protein KHW63_05585 [Alistipes sp.]|nr:hypothetical protein [Alistipes sp.]